MDRGSRVVAIFRLQEDGPLWQHREPSSPPTPPKSADGPGSRWAASSPAQFGRLTGSMKLRRAKEILTSRRLCLNLWKILVDSGQCYLGGDGARRRAVFAGCPAPLTRRRRGPWDLEPRPCCVEATLDLRARHPKCCRKGLHHLSRAHAHDSRAGLLAHPFSRRRRDVGARLHRSGPFGSSDGARVAVRNYARYEDPLQRRDWRLAAREPYIGKCDLSN